MNLEKKCELQNKIIKELKQENETLKQKIEFDKQYNTSSTEKAKILISELEEKIIAFKEASSDICKMKNEYKIRLNELKELRKKYGKDFDSLLNRCNKSSRKIHNI